MPAAAGAEWLLDAFRLLKKSPMGFGLLAVIYAVLWLIVVLVSSAAPDMAKVTAAAAKVKEYADQMGTWFPAGTGPEVTGAHTHAKPGVWTDRETFNTKLTALQTEAAKLAAVTDAAGFKAQFGPTGGTCKSCHDTFREEDKDHK